MRTQKYKIILIGNGTLAARGLEAVRQVADVPLVIADKHDTGEDTWRESLVKKALGAGYVRGSTLLQPGNPNGQEVVAAIAAGEPDMVLSLQCRHIIREPLFSVPTIGTFNLHNAPLPLLRGCDPFAWAIHDGLQEMGVSLHQILDEGVDNGPVVSQRCWAINTDDTAWDLYRTALDQALEVLIDTLGGELPQAKPQDARYCTYHPMGQFDFSKTRVDWGEIADTLVADIRSRIFPPIQLPYFCINKSKVEVLRCRKVSARGIPGAILSVEPLIVAAKWGGVELMELRLNGMQISPRSLIQHFNLKQGNELL